MADKTCTAFVLLENHFFKTPDGKIWCDRVIDYGYMQAYLQSFDQVILCGRCADISKENSKGKKLVSGKGISFVELPDFVGALGIAKNLLKIKKVIRESLKNVDYSIVRAPSPLSLATYPIFKKSGKPFVLEFVGAADKMFEPDNLLYRIINRILVKRAQKMCLTADGVAYVTKYTLQKDYPCRKAAITTNYLDLKSSFSYQQAWDINEQPKCFNIVHTGYMDSNKKGHNVLIDAARQMVDTGQTNFRITFIGDGRMRVNLEKKVANCGLKRYVKFVGAINDENEIHNILIKSHLFVFPSSTEGLPRSVIEAMAAGLVCIASPVGGIPEIIDEKYLVRNTKGDDYAKKIISVINNWPEMVCESKNNNKKAKEFEKDIMNQKRKEFYDNVKNKFEKINVLNVIGEMNVGGAETMLVNILRTIDSSKFKMFFLCYSDQKYDYEDEINKLGGTILRMHKKDPLRDIRTIKKIIRENNIKVVHSHTYHNSAMPTIAAKRTGVKVILTHSHTTKPKPAKSIIRKIYYAFSTFVINRYSDFLVSCGERASKGIFRDKSKICRFNNGIILEDFKFSDVNRKRIREELGVKDTTKVVGHVGRFTEAKNHEFILNIFHKYSKKNPDSILLLIGNGELLTDVKKQTQNLKLKNKVKFLGLRSDANRLYSAMDVLLFPSLFEGLPLTLVEAQVNGLSIVASDRIDRNVDLTGHIKFLPLEEKLECWIDALNCSTGVRYNNFEDISKNGYDMSVEVKKLEQIYLGKGKKCK